MSVILTLKGEWLAAPEADIPGLAGWLVAPGPAVQLASHEDPVPLFERGGALDLVLIDFPRFTDGRGYSLAVELRRAGYHGELRAVGEVLIDQVFLMKRVGFTQFAPRADQDRALAVAALTRYSEAYQGAVDEPLPAYRRHAQPVLAGDAA